METKSNGKNIYKIIFKHALSVYIFPDYKRSFKNSFMNILSRIGTWILIFTNFVPISLLLTMEMVKYAQGIFISWDIKLYDKESDTPAFVQTSTLNEELGQIQVNLKEKIILVYFLR